MLNKFIKANIIFIYILSGIFILFGCKEIATDKKHFKNDKTDSLHSLLLGKWGGLNEKSYVFEITPDSFYYPQHKKSYCYKLNNDSIILFVIPEGALLTNVKVVKDTLTYTDDSYGLIMYGYRFR